MTETTETLNPSTQNAEPTELVVNGVDDEKENDDARLIIASFVIGALTIAGLLIFLTDFLTMRKEEQAQTANAVVAPTYRDIRAREEGRLNAYKLLNEKDGVYQIPIDEAMKLVVKEAYERKLSATQPPQTPEPDAKQGAKKNIEKRNEAKAK